MKKFQYDEGNEYNHYLRRQKEHEQTKSWTSGKSYAGYISKVKENFPDAKSILCVGARDVSEVLNFRNAGFDAIGIDLFSSNVDIVKIVDMHQIADFFSENQFDLVFSCHSLEHSFDPIVVLEAMKKVSTTGCFLILPNCKDPTGKDPTVFEFMSRVKQTTLDSGLDTDVQYERENIQSEFRTLLNDSNVTLSSYDFNHQPDGKDREHWISLKW